jgi:hypothetical protein
MRTPRAIVVGGCALLVVATGCSTRSADGRSAAARRGAPSPDPAAAAAAEPAAPLPPSIDPLRVPVSHRGGKTNPADTSSRRAAQEDDAFFAAKLEAARDEIAAGHEEQALEILGAVMKLDPPPPWDGRVRALRLELRERQVGVDAVRVDARGERDYVPFDTDVDLVLRVRNVGTCDLVIRAPEGDGPGAVSGSTFVLTIQRLDRDVFGAELRRSWTQTVPLVTAETGALRIPPETSHEVRVRMPAEDAGGAFSGVRTLVVAGELRAGKIECGYAEPLGKVAIRPGRVLALPRGFEPIAADPLGSLGKAIRATAPIHVLIAAEFLPASGRVEAMRTIADGIATGEPALLPALLNAVRTIRRAATGERLQPLAEPLIFALRGHAERAEDLMEGLTALTGVSLAPDARLWEDWWRREVRSDAAVPGDEESTPRRKPGGAAKPGPR